MPQEEKELFRIGARSLPTKLHGEKRRCGRERAGSWLAVRTAELSGCATHDQFKTCKDFRGSDSASTQCAAACGYETKPVPASLRRLLHSLLGTNLGTAGVPPAIAPKAGGTPAVPGQTH